MQMAAMPLLDLNLTLKRSLNYGVQTAEAERPCESAGGYSEVISTRKTAMKRRAAVQVACEQRGTCNAWMNRSAKSLVY